MAIIIDGAVSVKGCGLGVTMVIILLLTLHLKPCDVTRREGAVIRMLRLQRPLGVEEHVGGTVEVNVTCFTSGSTSIRCNAAGLTCWEKSIHVL